MTIKPWRLSRPATIRQRPQFLIKQGFGFFLSFLAENVQSDLALENQLRAILVGSSAFCGSDPIIL
jgi:hypothetical protein